MAAPSTLASLAHVRTSLATAVSAAATTTVAVTASVSAAGNYYQMIKITTLYGWLF
jgi:hypothetical protein